MRLPEVYVKGNNVRSHPLQHTHRQNSSRHSN